MMEATDFAKRDDPAGLPEREMRSCAVIVREVRGQDATEVLLAENDDMVEALAPHGANEPFHDRILPGSRLQSVPSLDR